MRRAYIPVKTVVGERPPREEGSGHAVGNNSGLVSGQKARELVTYQVM
jgi:hypothetical protein